MRWKMRSRRMPALLMTPSIRPNVSTAVLIMRSAPAGSVTLSALGTALPPRHSRIIVAERAADFLERNVGKHAAIGEILHVPPAAEVERMVDRIGRAVPVERLEAEPLGQLPVEGRRRLHPAPVEPHLGV